MSNNPIISKDTIEAADFWCGAGGTSTGFTLAMHELAKATSFPDGYIFNGTKKR